MSSSNPNSNDKNTISARPTGDDDNNTTSITTEPNTPVKPENPAENPIRKTSGLWILQNPGEKWAERWPNMAFEEKCKYVGEEYGNEGLSGRDVMGMVHGSDMKAPKHWKGENGDGLKNRGNCDQGPVRRGEDNIGDTTIQ